jgi:phosphoglycolate phosphatase
MELTHVIFDLDGTLIDSRREILNTYKKVTDEIAPSGSVDLESIDYGATLHSVLSSIYQNNSLQIDEARTMFSTLYDQSDYTETGVYEGVHEVLKQLNEKEFKFYIATNKRLTPTLRILEQKQLLSFFTGIVCSDSIPGQALSKTDMLHQLCGQYHIDKGYMVGDSVQDLEAGAKSNLTTIAALYGYEKKVALLRNNPNFTISHFNEIITILHTAL